MGSRIGACQDFGGTLGSETVEVFCVTGWEVGPLPEGATEQAPRAEAKLKPCSCPRCFLLGRRELKGSGFSSREGSSGPV